MRNISKQSFIEALEARKDDVYVRILQDVSSLDCIGCEDFKILYHRACYKSYTSRRNCSYSMSEPTAVEPGHTTCIAKSFVPDSSINQLLNWEVCFLCEKKTFKKDRKLKKKLNQMIVGITYGNRLFSKMIKESSKYLTAKNLFKMLSIIPVALLSTC
jgi:hypothetical protein